MSRDLRRSTKADLRPSWQFYPDDWRSEPALGLCSLAARGLWIEMLCLMFGSPERGVLRKQNGTNLESKDLAKLMHSTEEEVSRLLSELDASGVLSRDDQGRVYNRRMVRDEHIRQVRSEAGKLGGRPSKMKGRRKAEKTPPSPTPSPSPSPAPLEEKSTCPTGHSSATPPPTCPALDIWNYWNDHRGGLPACRALSDERKKRLKTRWGNPEFRRQWAHIIDRAAASKFLAGENDRNFLADFEWCLLRVGNWEKILDGKYDDREGTAEAIRKKADRDKATEDQIARRHAEDALKEAERLKSTARTAALRQRYETLKEVYEALPIETREPIDAATRARELHRGTAGWLLMVGVKWCQLVEQTKMEATDGTQT